jgi:hypothetical protein
MWFSGGHQESLYTLRDGKSSRICPFPQNGDEESLTLAI